MKLYGLLQTKHPNVLPKYNKDTHKAVNITLLTTDLSKVTVLIFHTGSVLMAGANNVTSSTNSSLQWGLPDAMADAFEFITGFIFENLCEIEVQLPVSQKSKKRKQA